MAKEIKRKHTPLGKSYWGSTGAYEKEYKKLHAALVPDKDEAETKHGEMLRAIGNLTYEYGNNGNGNAVEQMTEDCPECHGGGYEDEEDEDGNREDCRYCGGECTVPTHKEFDSHFGEMVEYLKRNLPKEDKPIVEAFENYCLKGEVTAKGEDEWTAYNRLADAVIYYILTTENEPR